MNRLVKYIRRQDSGWKQAAGCSGETSINLSNEIFDFLSLGMVDSGEECGITFRIFKEDYVNALAFINSQLPLYRSTSRSSIIVRQNDPFLLNLENNIERFFGSEEFVDYTVILYCRKDGRIYLKGLKQNGFSIRDFLVEMSSALVFNNCIDGYTLRLESGVSAGELDCLTEKTDII